MRKKIAERDRDREWEGETGRNRDRQIPRLGDVWILSIFIYLSEYENVKKFTDNERAVVISG